MTKFNFFISPIIYSETKKPNIFINLLRVWTYATMKLPSYFTVQPTKQKQFIVLKTNESEDA